MVECPTGCALHPCPLCCPQSTYPPPRRFPMTRTDITPLQALRAIGLTDAEIRDGAQGHTVAPTIHTACIRAVDELDSERTPVTRDTPLGTEVTHDEIKERHWLVGWRRNGWILIEDGSGWLTAWDPDGWRVVEEVDQ